jgi:hypothetical protein
VEGPPGEEVRLEFRREGYLPTTRAVELVSSGPVMFDVALVPEAPPVIVELNDRERVASLDGVSVSMRRGDFVGPDGEPISGPVEVHIHRFDVREPSEVEGAAGTSRARTEEAEGAALVGAEAMIDITVRQDGKTLQVAPGEALVVDFPAAADSPATLPLWRYDPAGEAWIEGEHPAIRVHDSNVYRAILDHLSVWNVAPRHAATCIEGRAVDGDGDPLGGAQVQAWSLDLRALAIGTTSDDGRFRVAVAARSDATVLVRHARGGGESRIVTPGVAGSAVPPRPGDVCRDVGEWTVERGRLHRGALPPLDCAALPVNPLAGTCAGAAFDALTCFHPQGACSLDYNDGRRLELSWPDGSRYTASVPDGRHISVTTRSSAGLCLEAEVDRREPERLTIVTAAGARFETIYEEQARRMVWRCPGGEEVVLELADYEAAQACGILFTGAIYEGCL